jgi:membrane-associated protease RseP (regulator of RpoE activity)
MQMGLGQPDYELGYPLIFKFVHGLLTSAGLIQGSAAWPLDRMLLHPMAIAAWVGMLATSLNLLPGGQLDGGHIIFSMAPQAHKLISRLTILVLVFMAYYLWTGWFLWAILLWVSSFRQPQVAEWPRVSGGRLWLAVFALVMLLVTLTPAPLGHSSLPEVVRQFRGR